MGDRIDLESTQELDKLSIDDLYGMGPERLFLVAFKLFEFYVSRRRVEMGLALPELMVVRTDG